MGFIKHRPIWLKLVNIFLIILIPNFITLGSKLNRIYTQGGNVRIIGPLVGPAIFLLFFIWMGCLFFLVIDLMTRFMQEVDSASYYYSEGVQLLLESLNEENGVTQG